LTTIVQFKIAQIFM